MGTVRADGGVRVGERGDDAGADVLDRLLKAARYRNDGIWTGGEPASRSAARYQTIITALQNTFAGLRGSILCCCRWLSIIFG